MFKIIKQYRLIILILITALLLRIIALNQSLWLDEAIGALVVKNYSYKEIFTKFLIIDNHPPLYYIILKFWSQLFGYSEFSLRFPSVLFSLATIALTYKTAQKLVDVKHKYYPEIASLLFGFSQFSIYFSQEARMYSMASFFVTLAVYSYINLINDNNRNIYLFLFSASILAAIYTDYLPVLILPVFWIYALFIKMGKKWWISFILSHIPLLIVSVFWLPYLLKQMEGGSWLISTLPAWKNVAGGATFKQAALVWMKFTLGRISFSNKMLYYTLVIISSIPFILSMYKSWTAGKKIILIWFWLAIPLFLGFIMSFIFPAFIYFRFLFILPAFYLIIGWGITNLSPNYLKYLLLLVFISIDLFSWFVYVRDSGQQREDWKGAVKFIEGNIKNNEAVIFEYPQPFAPYRWYMEDQSFSFGVTNSISADPQKTLTITDNVIKDKSGIYYFEYLRDLSDPNRVVESELKLEGFSVRDIYNFNGVGQVYYLTK